MVLLNIKLLIKKYLWSSLFENISANYKVQTQPLNCLFSYKINCVFEIDPAYKIKLYEKVIKYPSSFTTLALAFPATYPCNKKFLPTALCAVANIATRYVWYLRINFVVIRIHCVVHSHTLTDINLNLLVSTSCLQN